jgi:hypothetical protein
MLNVFVVLLELGMKTTRNGGTKVGHLTAYGGILDSRRPVTSENVKHYGNCLDLDPVPLPDFGLMVVHPLTAALLSASTKYIVPGTEDKRWQWESLGPSAAKVSETRHFMLSLIEQTYGSLEVAWREYLDVARTWGAIAGKRWSLLRDGVCVQRWNEIPDERRKELEDKCMVYLGISEEYPARSTRANVILNNMRWWLLDMYNQRLLGDNEARAIVSDATESLLAYRYCAVCGRKYQRIQIPQYLPHRLLSFEDCCLGCPLYPSKEKDFPVLMRRLVEACGFVPDGKFHFEQRAFVERIVEDKFIALASAYVDLGGAPYISQKYGSWMKAVLLSGILGSRAKATKRGIVCIAKDGDLCRSIGEMTIDDWLFDRGIAHEKEPKYPLHPVHNPRGGMRGDWKVGDVYVEYFGLVGDPTYDSRVQKKHSLARELGIKLLPIFPSDMKTLDSRLSLLL